MPPQFWRTRGQRCSRRLLSQDGHRQGDVHSKSLMTLKIAACSPCPSGLVQAKTGDGVRRGVHPGGVAVEDVDTLQPTGS